MTTKGWTRLPESDSGSGARSCHLHTRRSPKVSEVILPSLYLHGLSSGDFTPALRGVLRRRGRLVSRDRTPPHQATARGAWLVHERELSEKDYAVYAWVDGTRMKVRLGHDDRLCRLPVMVGARPGGEKEPVAVQDGHRESEGSWAELFGDLKKRGM